MNYSGIGYAVYSRLPVSLQNRLVTYIGNRRWKHETSEFFQKIVTELMKLQFSTPENIRILQKRRLVSVLRAAKSTDFYSSILPSHSVLEKEPFRVLKDVPALCKEQIRDNIAAFINRDFQGKLIRHGTSGTTGTPLQTIWTEKSMDMERALIWRHRLQTGFSYGSSWRATLGGHRIVPLSSRNTPYWRISKKASQLYMSTYHISPDTAGYYTEAIEQFDVRALEGYPSVLYALAYAMNSKSLSYPLQGIYYGAEPMHDFQRELLTKVFQCQVWDYYGLTERNASASEFECRNGLHENWENCILETVDPEGNPLSDGEYGELVGTSLSNLGFPLLRYRTGDMTRILVGECTCGRGSRRIARIDTKREDLLLMPDGSLLSASNLTFPFKESKNIIESQIYQSYPDIITVRIIPSDAYTEKDGNHLKSGLSRFLPDSVSVEIKIVKEIPRTASGKHRFCVSDLTGK